MICEPSVWPTFIRPIVLTRQLFQPSVNFFEPISRLTVDCGLLISWKSEPENSRSPVGNPVLFAQLHQLGVVADVDDAERIVVADAQRDLAGGALQVLDVQRAAAGGVEEGRQRFVEHLGGGEAGSVEIGEAPGEQVLPASGDEPLIEHALDALDAARPIRHIARQELAGSRRCRTHRASRASS